MNSVPMKASVKIFQGRVSKLSDGTPSGIFKSPTTGPVEVGLVGLAQDEQADLKNHGGTEKALHHYAFDHYKTWCSEFPQLSSFLEAPGAFGENISTLGMTEETVCVGDVFRLGEATVQVSQGRQPCWKLGVRFEMKRMPLLVQRTGRLGWYYRVLEPGMVESGQTMELVERPHSEWPLKRLTDLLYINTDDYDSLAAMASLEFLTDSWKATAKKRLEKRQPESWVGRLTNNLEAAYSEASYQVECPALFDLRIGVSNPDFAQWLHSQNIESWTIVTACNPFSEPLSDAENAQRMMLLEASLISEFSAQNVFAARGVATDESWEEASFLVTSVSEERAKTLGKEFEQNAVVYGESDAIGRLIWCFRDP